LIDRFSVKTASQIKDWATKQAYLALGNLLTVCAVEQIDSCPMEGFIPKQIDEILALEKENLSSVLLLPIGKRAEDDENAIHKKVRITRKGSIDEKNIFYCFYSFVFSRIFSGRTC